MLIEYKMSLRQWRAGDSRTLLVLYMVDTRCSVSFVSYSREVLIWSVQCPTGTPADRGSVVTSALHQVLNCGVHYTHSCYSNSLHEIFLKSYIFTIIMWCPSLSSSDILRILWYWKMIAAVVFILFYSQYF